jgi:hypothetical protein
MKKLLFKISYSIWALLLFCVSTKNSQAQCWETLNTVTTNWQSYPSPSANDFDWTQEEYANFYMKKNYDANSGTTPPATLTLPMWQEQSASNNNKNLEHFQLQTASFKDFHPEDGWELLVKSFGECCTESKAVENPFYAIYNRYTGVIRAFVYIARTPTSLDLNGAIMTLEFSSSSRRTAMLQHLQPIANPVKEFIPTNVLQMPNHYKNSSYWLYAEFQTAYDPCACALTDNSLITFVASLMRYTTLNAELEGTIVENVVTDDGTGKSSPAASNSLFTIGRYDLVDGVNEGIKGYKNWDGYRKQAASFLDKQDQKYRDKLAQQVFDAYPGGIYIDGNQITDINGLKNLDAGWKKLLGIDVSDPQIKLLKGLASALPYVGTAISLFDFFTGGGAESTDVKTVRSPMAFDARLKMKGDLTTVADQEVVTIYTPGTKTSAPNSLPIYNNILGVVNVLDIPPLEYVQYTPDEAGAYPTSAKIRQYRLSNDLKYVLNPASKLEMISAEACYIIEFDNTIIFGNDPLIQDVDQMPVEFGNFATAADWTNYRNSNDVVKRMENQGYELEYISDDYLTNGGTIRFRTPYVPLGCFKTQSFALNYRDFSNSTFRNKAPRVFLKIIFRMKRVNNSTADPITSVLSFTVPDPATNAVPFTTTEFTYKTKKSWLNSNPPNTAWIWTTPGYTSFPEFASTLNAPDEINITSGQTISKDVYAKKKITIAPGVTINSGVSLYAGEKIDIDPNNTFPSGVNFYITKKLGNCDQPVTNMHESNTGITAVCNNTTYQTSALSKKGDSEPGFEQNGPDFLEWKTTIKPNPTVGDFFLELTGNSAPETEIEITNLMGQSVYKTKLANPQVENKVYFIQDLQLACGIYLVSVTNANKTDVTKLIITRQ